MRLPFRKNKPKQKVRGRDKGPEGRSLASRMSEKGSFGIRGSAVKGSSLSSLFEESLGRSYSITSGSKLANAIARLLKVRHEKERDLIEVSPPFETGFGRHITPIKTSVARHLFEQDLSGAFIIKVSRSDGFGSRYFKITAFEYPDLYLELIKHIEHLSVATKRR